MFAPPHLCEQAKAVGLAVRLAQWMGKKAADWVGDPVLGMVKKTVEWATGAVDDDDDKAYQVAATLCCSVLYHYYNPRP